jgi:DNA polymerase/3'-5' exonuclease PolX
VGKKSGSTKGTVRSVCGWQHAHACSVHADNEDAHSSRAQYDGGTKFDNGALDAKTEEEIFHVLKLEFVPPELRSV